MPVCFQLIDKSKPEEGPVALQKIDELMRAHFEAPCDPVKYLGGWYDSIGFRLACGKTFDQIRAEFNKYVEEDRQGGKEGSAIFYENLLQIVSYLDERYTTNSFYERK